MTKIVPIVLIGVIGVIAALAGCGAGAANPPAADPSAATTGAPATANVSAVSGRGHHLQLAVAPGGALRFTKRSLTADAGQVSIRFTNRTAVPHDLTIQRGTSGPVLAATPMFTRGSKVLTVRLKPGRYTFFCSVPGHRQAGMQGTLVVK